MRMKACVNAASSVSCPEKISIWRRSASGAGENVSLPSPISNSPVMPLSISDTKAVPRDTRSCMSSPDNAKPAASNWRAGFSSR